MITIRRRTFLNQTWFQIIDGPAILVGIFIDAGTLQALVGAGVEVTDLDAINAEREYLARWQ